MNERLAEVWQLNSKPEKIEKNAERNDSAKAVTDNYSVIFS